MLSIFPELLPFSLLGVFLVRVVVGLSLLWLSIDILFDKKDKLVKKLEQKNYFLAKAMVWLIAMIALITSGFLIIGFLTQVSAIVVAYLFLNLMILDSGKIKILGQGKMFYVAMTLISLSLLFLGPGIWAIDLPL